MSLNRRDFLHLVGAGSVAAVLPAAMDSPRPADSRPPTSRGRAARFRAVAFDAFPILDPRPVAARAEMLFPNRGSELMAAWRTRQFEYTWLRSLGRRYADFWQVTDSALQFAAASLRLPLTSAARSQLMQLYLELPAWPDVLPALTRLRNAGLQLGFLSNFTPAMLAAGVRNAGLGTLMTHVLSTDAVQSYKPDPRAYQLGVDTFGRPREEILFAAFAGWDAAGAKWFGYPTFWVNRLGAAPEELGVAPDAMGRGLTELVDFALG